MTSTTRSTWSPTNAWRWSRRSTSPAKCFARTCDFVLVTRDPAVVSGLTALFAADWADQPAMLTDAQRERLIVGPDGDPRARVRGLLHDARQRIRLLDTKLTDPAILSRARRAP